MANPPVRTEPKHQPLSLLPLQMIIRSLVTSTVSSSPKLLTASLYVLNILAHSKLRFLNPDHNKVLRYILNASLYKQFCAGENATEVAATVRQVKDIGFTGAILAYAKETPSEPDPKDLGELDAEKRAEQKANREISEWRENSLETVRLATAGDFVGFK